MSKEEGPPAHIAQYYDKKKQLELLLNTTHLKHSEAYIHATEAIKIEDGKLDYELLDDEGKRDEFIKRLTDHYVKSAKEAFKSELGKTELEKEQLLNAYIGTTGTALKRFIDQNKSRYTLDMHNDNAKGLVNELEKTLKPHISSHLKQRHVASIVDYTGAGEFVDAGLMRPEDTLPYLDVYDQGKGRVQPKMAKGKVFERKREEGNVFEMRRKAKAHAPEAPEEEELDKAA